MSTLSIYPCGGAGINILDLWSSNGKSPVRTSAKIVGLDMSTNNLPKGDAFPVKHLGGRGGGKRRGTNHDFKEDFVESVLSSNKPGDFAIVVYSTSGSSGGTLGPIMHRSLIKRGVPVISIIIGDTTSQKELTNTSATFKTLDKDRRLLNHNIVYDYVLNDLYPTRGDADKAALVRLDLATVFLTDAHQESDFEDIKNFFNISGVTPTPAALNRINYFDDKASQEKIRENAVAGFGLYKTSDRVDGTLSGTAYRTTGVMNPDLVPSDVNALFMILDHDHSVGELLAMIDDADDRVTQDRQRFKEVKSLGGDSQDEDFL